MFRNPIPFLLLLLELVVNHSYAQKVEVSAPVKITSKTDKVKIVGRNQDGYVIRLSGEEEVFHIYGNDMRLASAKTFEMKNGDGFIQHVQLYKSGGIIYYLHPLGRTTVLIAQVVNGKFQNNGAALPVDTFQEGIDIIQVNLRVKQSIDQQYTLFYSPVFNAKNIDAMQVTCVDKNINRIFKQFPIIQKAEREMEFAKSFVDTNGNALMIFNNSSNMMTARFLERGIDYVNSFSIPFAKKIFGDPYIEIDNKNNQLIVAGFYDNEIGMSESAAYGFFYKAYNYKLGALLEERTTAFPDSFIKSLTGRDASQTNNRLYTFNIKKVIQRLDGGISIVAESSIKDRREEQAISLSAINPYNSYRIINTFQSNDIISFSIKPNGELDWTTIMRKKQYSEEDNGFNSSFFCINQKDKLHFIYPEDISFSSDVNEYVLSSDGASDKRQLFSQEDKDVFLVPKQGRQTALNEAVIPSIKKGELRLVRIKY